MDIYLLDTEQGKMAFVNFGKGYMICIGTKKEVDEATPEKLVRMIWEAVAHCQYNSLNTTTTQAVH